MTTNKKKSKVDIRSLELTFDPVTGTYIDIMTGLVLLPEELPEPKGVSLTIKEDTPPTIDEFFNHLQEELAEGLFRARNKSWAQSIRYPDMEVGQTSPFIQGEVPLEHYQVGSKVIKIRGVDDKGNLLRGPSSIELRKDQGVEFNLVDSFRNHYTKKKQSPDCVTIEGKTTLDSQDEIPDLGNLFEALWKLLRRLTEDPNGRWVKIIPTLIDFCVDGISFPFACPECNRREFGIPELLSTFSELESYTADLEDIIVKLTRHNKQLAQDKKHLRGQIYGHKKHDKLHMK